MNAGSLLILANFLAHGSGTCIPNTDPDTYRRAKPMRIRYDNTGVKDQFFISLKINHYDKKNRKCLTQVVVAELLQLLSCTCISVIVLF
jgi:hypothetical protein